MNEYFSVIVAVSLFNCAFGSFFYGGSIAWQVEGRNPSNNLIEVKIRQRYSWNLIDSFCDDAAITDQRFLGSGLFLSTHCLVGNCPSLNNISTDVICTDYDTDASISTGERYSTVMIPTDVSFAIAHSSDSWPIKLVSDDAHCSIVSIINTFLRPDGVLNSSPMAMIVPVLYRQVDIEYVHQLFVIDKNMNDDLRCRWADNSGESFTRMHECGGICQSMVASSHLAIDCTLTFKLTQSSVYYGVAIQVEDYFSQDSTSPMSSIPIQFLIYSTKSMSGCDTPPEIIGNRQNRERVVVHVGSAVFETVIARVNCLEKTITRFVTVSPVGMRKTEIQHIGSNLYLIHMTWTPSINQTGLVGFCAAAIDNSNIQSSEWCLTFSVDSLQKYSRSSAIQGTAIPVGTIFSNHSIFSISFTAFITRPTTNGTFIRFTSSTSNITLYEIDCASSSLLVYSSQTVIVIFGTGNWTPGESYYVTLDAGVGISTNGTLSDPITDRNFWTFNIWNPGSVSTTGVVATVTTRAPLTTAAANQSSQYVCQTNQSSFQWTLYSSAHSAWNPSNSCALSFCNSSSSNSSCRRSQTPCFEYVAYSNISYCAPAALCSLMPSCNQTSTSCPSNSGVCIWNSCCSSPVCLPLSWTSLCTS